MAGFSFDEYEVSLHMYIYIHTHTHTPVVEHLSRMYRHQKQQLHPELGLVVYACNPNTGEVETAGSLGPTGHPSSLNGTVKWQWTDSVSKYETGNDQGKIPRTLPHASIPTHSHVHLHIHKNVHAPHI